MNLLIRRETPEDFSKVYHVVREAFRDMPLGDHDEQNLVVRLRESPVFVPELSLVALAEDSLVGHILFTELTIRGEETTHTTLMLAPLSVLPGMQRRGIGGRLILAGHEAARNLGYTSVLLVGHPAYYPRFGYRRASTFGITLPMEAPDEAFLACELAEGALKNVRGEVEFPEAFGFGG